MNGLGYTKSGSTPKNNQSNKTVFGSAFQQSLSTKSLKSDVYFSAIVQILTAILAVRINKTKYIRSKKADENCRLETYSSTILIFQSPNGLLFSCPFLYVFNFTARYIASERAGIILPIYVIVKSHISQSAILILVCRTISIAAPPKALPATATAATAISAVVPAPKISGTEHKPIPPVVIVTNACYN